MSGSVLAKIYLGKITNWNDPAIKKLNPGNNLPSKKITVVHRSDGSGTTYNFTDYLSSVSARPGRARSARARRSTGRRAIGAPHSSGVAAVVKQTPGAIGYAETSYPVHNHLTYFRMQNRSRQVRPAEADGHRRSGAARHASCEGRLALDRQPAEVEEVQERLPDLHLHVHHRGEAEQAGRRPPAAASAGRSRRVRAFGPKLFFAPLPKPVVKFDKKSVKKIQ